MHPTKAPRLNELTRTLVDVRRGRALAAGKIYSSSDTDGEEVLIISSPASPTMVVEKSGAGRLLRSQRRHRCLPPVANTYVDGKVYWIPAPFEQPLHKLVEHYETAVGGLPRQHPDGSGPSLP